MNVFNNVYEQAQKKAKDYIHLIYKIYAKNKTEVIEVIKSNQIDI